MITRHRGSLVPALFCAFCLALLSACQEEPTRPALAQGERPNVVLLLVDDLRWDETGYAGNLVATPHIDRLAREGVHFENAYVTSSLCSPSRASFLTGVYPHTHGVYSNSTGLDFERTPTIAQLLQEAGYNTGLVGKWHMGGDSEPRPGFDHWLALPGQGAYVDPEFNNNGEVEIVEGYNTDLLTEAAIDFIDESAERPFYLHLGYKAVHAPFLAAPRHRDALVDEDFASLVRPTTRRDRLSVRRLRAESLLAIDDSVGQIVQHLRKRDLLENTVLVFTSDNGFLFGEHGHSDKRLFYEESIRIPWLVYQPGLPAAGRVIEEPVLNIDFLPSMLALAGVAVPDHVQGRSFSPLLQGKPAADWREFWVYEYFAELAFPHIATHLAVVGPEYKYVWFPEGADLLRRFSGEDLLFNLREDPFETENLLHSAAHTQVLEAKREQLRAFAEQTQLRFFDLDPEKVRARVLSLREDPEFKWFRDELDAAWEKGFEEWQPPERRSP